MCCCSKTISVATWLNLFWLALPLCLVAGCSCLHRSESTLPFDATPAAIECRVVAPVTLEIADTPPDTVAPDHSVSRCSAAGTPRTAPDSALAVSNERGARKVGQRTRDESMVAPQLSPLAPVSPPLAFSLRQALTFGLENNPRLQAALSGIERARGQEQAAFAPFLPEIDLLSHGGVTSPALGPAPIGLTGIVIPNGNDTHSFAHAELQLQWTIWDFGRRSGRYQQAGARTRIAELQSSRAEQTVGFDVGSAYLQALQARALRRIQEEAIRRARATLRDTVSRRVAGVAERDDVLRADVQVAAAEEDLDLAGESELGALAWLNNTMGRNASLPVTVVDDTAWSADGGATSPALPLSLVQCLEIAGSRRPEIAIAREAAAAAEYGRQATAAEFWPRVYALSSAGAIGGSNVVTGGQEGAGLHIDMPIFKGGRLKGDLRAADADIRQALADTKIILDNVSLQVTLAHLDATTARRRIERNLPAVIEARENLRLVRNRYRNGNATPTDIVDAETSLTRAQQRLALARYGYLRALVRLDYAMGNPPGHFLELPQSDTEVDAELPEILPEPRGLPRMQKSDE